MKLLISVAALLIIGCQQKSLELMRNEFRDNAGKALNEYSQAVSGYYKARVKGIRGALADSLSGELMSFPMNNYYYGNESYWRNYAPQCYDYYYGIQYQINRCVDMVKSIPEKRENFYFMIATLSRCLNNIVSFQNPIFTYAYRNLGSDSQTEWPYLIDTIGWGSFEEFPSVLSDYWGSIAGGVGCMNF